MASIVRAISKYPHFHRGRFYNHKDEIKPPFLVPSMHMLLEWYHNQEKKKPLNFSSWVEKYRPQYNTDSTIITWIGHSTFLIQIGSINILTDPVFGNLPLFKRIIAPGIVFNDLPKIDYVIISHNHRDHMDAATIKMLVRQNNKIMFLVPMGDKAWFSKRGINNVRENIWWDKHTFYQGDYSVDFTFLPAYHWTQRGIFDYNRSLWGSWMISGNGKNIYFAGDSAYASHFKDISREFELIEVALMPIGPCEPRKWMSHSHVSAQEAGQAFLDLKATHFIPMHWGTYYFGTDQFELPIELLLAWWKEKALKNKVLHILKIGQSVLFDDLVYVFPKTPEIQKVI